MARNKRKNSNDLKNEAEAKKEEVVQDNVTKIGQNIDSTENENDEIDGDTSDSSVYSDLEDDGEFRTLTLIFLVLLEYKHLTKTTDIEQGGIYTFDTTNTLGVSVDQKASCHA